MLGFLFVFCTAFCSAQTRAFGYVKDSEGKPLENVEIELITTGEIIRTDKIGYFQWVDLKEGEYLMSFVKLGFETKIIAFQTLKKERRKNLGEILLSRSEQNNMGIVVVDESSLDGDEDYIQPTVGLLSAGKNTFQRIAAYELGAYWFRPKGIDNKFERVLFNGISMSKNHDGRIDFSNWAGLNGVTRFPYEFSSYFSPSSYAFGSLGSTAYFDTRASGYKKGLVLNYSLTNRSYTHRLAGTYSSGVSKKGWAFTFSGSRRWANRGIIEGTYQDSYAYFVSVEKKISDKFSVNLTGFGAPTYKAGNSPNTQEVYDLAGKNYNSYWGWQNGKKRNSRIIRSFEPVIQLQFYKKIGKKTKWNHTFSYQWGRKGVSRLDRFGAPSEDPAYYRNLPSYWRSLYQRGDSEKGGIVTATEQNSLEEITNKFKENRQINWAVLYQANRNNLEKGALYSLAEDVRRDRTFSYFSHFDTKIKDHWKLNLNFLYQNLSSENYRKIKDLLGANYASNLNPFDGNNSYNTDSPNTRVYKGGEIHYSYGLNRQIYSLNVSTEINLSSIDFVGSVFAQYSESYRTGNFRNYFYPGNSKGKSKTYGFSNFGVKAKTTFKFNGRNFIVHSGAYFSVLPTLSEVFINPRISNFATPNTGNEKVTANSLSYFYRSNSLKLSFSAYWIDILGATDITRYYTEGLPGYGEGMVNQNALVTEAVTGAEKRYKGIEIAFETSLLKNFGVFGLASLGNYTYQNSPYLYYSVEQGSGPRGLRFLGEANIKNYRIAGTPQKAISLGVKYSSPDLWWLSFTGNYLADQYLGFSALSRTSLFYTDPITGNRYKTIDNYNNSGIRIPEAGTSEVSSLLQQKATSGQLLFNINAGKLFPLGKYRLGFVFSVNNVFNNRNYISGGYEQSRKSNFREAYLDAQRQSPMFGTKIWYDRGRTYFINLSVRF
ncbi:MAG: TonB-dependent receptor [Bergeyella sp.]|nr:TonB-dependent receptor [Bergeyella sp.]